MGSEYVKKEYVALGSHSSRMPGEREGGRHGHVICGAIGGGGGGKVQQFINYYYYYYYYYKSCVVCLNCIGMATM